MSSITAELRNGFNNTIRRAGHGALRFTQNNPLVSIPANLAVNILTTPIHIGRNATDLNSNGKRDWDAKSLVIGTKSAKASHGTAIAIGDSKAGNESNAISLRGKADSGKGGTSISLSAKGATSVGKSKKLYSSTYNVNKPLAQA